MPWLMYNHKLENQVEAKDENVPQKKYKIFTEFNQFAPQLPITALADPVLKAKDNFVFIVQEENFQTIAEWVKKKAKSHFKLTW